MNNILDCPTTKVRLTWLQLAFRFWSEDLFCERLWNSAVHVIALTILNAGIDQCLYSVESRHSHKAYQRSSVCIRKSRLMGTQTSGDLGKWQAYANSLNSFCCLWCTLKTSASSISFYGVLTSAKVGAFTLMSEPQTSKDCSHPSNIQSYTAVHYRRQQLSCHDPLPTLSPAIGQTAKLYRVYLGTPGTRNGSF